MLLLLLRGGVVPQWRADASSITADGLSKADGTIVGGGVTITASLAALGYSLAALPAASTASMQLVALGGSIGLFAPTAGSTQTADLAALGGSLGRFGAGAIAGASLSAWGAGHLAAVPVATATASMAARGQGLFVASLAYVVIGPLSAARTWRIEPQSRTLTLAAEARRYRLAPESRTWSA